MLRYTSQLSFKESFFGPFGLKKDLELPRPVGRVVRNGFDNKNRFFKIKKQILYGMDLLQRKGWIVYASALIITAMVSIPRFALLLGDYPFNKDFDITVPDLLFRFIWMLVFILAVMHFNLNLLSRFWFGLRFREKILRGIVVNLLLAGLFIAGFIFLKPLLMEVRVPFRNLVLTTTFVYLVLTIILWLISGVVLLSADHQKNVLEKERLKFENIRNQLDVLRNQVNPHFLFNTLNSLSALIRQGSDKALIFVDKLSYLLRYSLQSTDQDLISLQEELEFLDAYIYLQKERYGDKLEIVQELPPGWLNRKLPAMSLQILLENAIKHNEISTVFPLRVHLFTEGNFLVLQNTIQPRREPPASTQKGLQNLSNRFQLLNRGKIQILKENNLFTVKLPMQEA